MVLFRPGDLLNFRGDPVASGVYVFQVESGAVEVEPGKILVIR